MSPPTVRRLAAALSARALLVLGSRALLVALGAGAGAFVVVATAVGPVPSKLAIATAWVVTAAACLGTLAWNARALWRLRGARIASVLNPLSPSLASATRSALELEHDPHARKWAPELIEAHRARTEEALRKVPPRRAVPWRVGFGRATIVAAGVLVLAGFGLALFPAARAGGYALLFPAARDVQGRPMVLVVDSIRAKITFPAYRHAPGSELVDPRAIEAAAGSVVDLRVTTRIDAPRAVMSVAGRDVMLVRSAPKQFAGRFVVRDSGPLAIRVRREGVWLSDASRRDVLAVVDRDPVVNLVQPSGNIVAESSDTLTIEYDAQDDVALSAVDLVVIGAGGSPLRRPLAHFEGAAQLRTSGTTHFIADELEAKPGDELTLWVEATDGDDVNGPHIGKSEVRIVRIASEATRREAALVSLAELLQIGLDALADELERGDSAAPSVRPRESAARLAEALLRASGSRGDPANPAVLREMGRRVADRAKTAAKTKGTDERFLGELERDVLLLADLLDQGRIDDAAAITRELDALRREMKDLLAKLRASPNADTRRALLAAIQRAEERLKRLSSRLSELAKHVPSDFVNAQAIEAAAPRNALADFKSAVERGDLADAEKKLLELERQIDQVANALGDGSESFEDARLGAREQAMGEALDALAGLEAEQRDLAQRTAGIRKATTSRAIKSMGEGKSPKLDGLAERARTVRKELDQLRGRDLDPDSKEVLDGAKDRLKDVESLLRSGDLGEAREMAREASAATEGLSRDLGLSALMFPGHDGQTTEHARTARRAEKEMRDLEDAIDRAIPSMDSYVDSEGAKRMRSDAPRQKEVRSASERLSEKFRNGPEGLPLDPEAADSMSEAAERMADAKGSLDKSDPIGASRAQSDAAEKLSDLRRRLEHSRSSSQDNSGDGTESSERTYVRIPTGDEHKSPSEMRRKLLDALREDPPRGYEDAVKKYYQELLR